MPNAERGNRKPTEGPKAQGPSSNPSRARHECRMWSEEEPNSGPRSLGELAAVLDHHRLRGPAGLGAHRLDLLHHIHALGDRAEDDVLAIQPRSLRRAEEELGSVGVGASIGHRQDARASVLELERLIGELGAVDALAAGAVASGKVAGLAHEARDDSVEAAALEVKGLAGLANALLAGAQSTEVLRGPRGNVLPELHHDSACLGLANDHVEEDLGVGHDVDELLEQVELKIGGRTTMGLCPPC